MVTYDRGLNAAAQVAAALKIPSVEIAASLRTPHGLDALNHTLDRLPFRAVQQGGLVVAAPARQSGDHHRAAELGDGQRSRVRRDLRPGLGAFHQSLSGGAATLSCPAAAPGLEAWAEACSRAAMDESSRCRKPICTIPPTNPPAPPRRWPRSRCSCAPVTRARASARVAPIGSPSITMRICCCGSRCSPNPIAKTPSQLRLCRKARPPPRRPPAHPRQRPLRDQRAYRVQSGALYLGEAGLRGRAEQAPLLALPLQPPPVSVFRKYAAEPTA